MAQVISRRVLISEKDFPHLRHNCLVRSEYGNERLYDTCDWRPITSRDLLMHVLKYNTTKNLDLYMRHYQRWGYQDYRDYEFWFDNQNLLIGRKPHSRYPVIFGWATVTKTKE